jgi:hypothetical protein
MSVRGGFDIMLEHLNNDLIRMGGLIEELLQFTESFCVTATEACKACC